MATDITELTVDTAGIILGIKAAKTAFQGLDRVLSSISGTIRDAFSVKGFEDYKDTVTRFGKELADQLLVLQLSFGKMKYAIAEAVAPIATVFVPMLNAAIQAVIRFSNVVGQFLRGLIAGVTGNQNLADSAKEAVRSEEALGSAAKAAGKAVRRSLASFDQLQRLNGSTGSGGSSATADLWGGFDQDPISPQVQALVDKVLALLAPLTLSVYPFVWYHKLCARIGDELQRRSIDYKFGPSQFWLWGILGSFILVGPFIFTHKLMKSMNLLNKDFNENG